MSLYTFEEAVLTTNGTNDILNKMKKKTIYIETPHVISNSFIYHSAIYQFRSTNSI